MNAQIDGRVAVVTGGSSGIGFETLRLLLGEGAKVAFCGRDPDRLASAHATLQNEFPHGEIFAYRCDVLNADEVQAFADAVQARFSAADMLINNAGQGYVAHFHDTPREAWLHEAELKLFGVINPVQAFQPLLEQSDIASVTCVNSLLALQPEEHMIATSAARAALLNMTLTLSKELVGKGIRVNSILLGMVESGQWQRRFENRADKSQSWPEWTADIARKRGIPMARLGKPQEPAQALLFLASPLASFTTGALADSALEQRLLAAGGKLTLLSGAVAGIDGLAAAKEGGLERVTYQSRKSPASWRGSYAEQLIDLNAVTEEKVFFEGSAREAARLFPANANVAATVALGGVGMDDTRVQLMVDPATKRNTHTLHVEGLFGEFHLELSGLPLASNPKTSTLAALSAVRACRELALS
ncbi:SDR family oxidoreductase [Enterobacter hormaechei]